MFIIGRFACDDRAGLEMRTNGEFELRLITGEIFHLGDKSITRIIDCRDSARQEAFSYQPNYPARSGVEKMMRDT